MIRATLELKEARGDTPIKVGCAMYVENEENGRSNEYMGYIWLIPKPSPQVRIGFHEVPLSVFENFCSSIELKFFPIHILKEKELKENRVYLLSVNMLEPMDIYRVMRVAGSVALLLDKNGSCQWVKLGGVDIVEDITDIHEELKKDEVRYPKDI